MEFFNVLNRMQICSPDNAVADGVNNFGFMQPNGRGGFGSVLSRNALSSACKILC